MFFKESTYTRKNIKPFFVKSFQDTLAKLIKQIVIRKGMGINCTHSITH